MMRYRQQGERGGIFRGIVNREWKVVVAAEWAGAEWVIVASCYDALWIGTAAVREKTARLVAILVETEVLLLIAC